MRLLSLRLKNFKGVEREEVEFRPTGVTLIQGPNEVGKTSLMNALDILIEYADSSQRREVEATQPSGRDRGTEIEARFRIRDQEFTYWKRYHRERETRLTIEQRGERRSLAGREAHDYVKDLLMTHTDWDLWKALKIAQGIATDSVTHVALGASTSLREALDRAAGGREALADDTLFQRVSQERDRYYSATGHERKAAFGEAQDRVRELKDEAEELERRVERVETDIEQFDHLDREIRGVTLEAQEAQQNLRALKDSLAQVEALEVTHRDALQKLRQAQDRLHALSRQWSERSRVSEQESELTQGIAELDEGIQAAMKEEVDAQRSLAGAKAENEAAEVRRLEARQTFERLNEDANIFIVRHELSLLRNQVDRIRQFTQEMAAQETARSRIHINEDGLKALRKQADKVHAARSGLEVGSPTAVIRALNPITVTVNGTPLALAGDDEEQLSVAEPIEVRVPGTLAISMSPGASVSDLQKKLDREQTAMQQLLDEYGVSNLTDAESRWDQWRQLSVQVEHAKGQLQTELAGSDLSALERRHAELAAQVDEYQGRRADDYRYPESADEARDLAEQARQAMDAAEDVLRESIRRLEGAKERIKTVQKQLQLLGAERVKQREVLSSILGALEQARQAMPDEILQTQVTETSQDVETLKAQVDAIAHNVEQLQPDQVRTRATQVEIQVANLIARVEHLRRQRAECQGRLTTMGGEGLYEELEEARSALDQAQGNLAALARRAQAAKLLYDVISACRDAEQRRYRDPLRKRITELGRVVFGNDFDVVLDENLAVVSRQLHGITLDVDVLSTGAKEQLALLIRLAAASLVDPDEGVPIILDDTLGHTDDERLDLMAAVLNVVAKDCQIILLTSATRRFTKIAQAHIVDLWRSRPPVQSVHVGDGS